ncbi:MAG: HNH endonuclease, partial [Polyangiaceae bacterium]|nr:HNH endonuclease [Polyangiaceae bacterium]
MGGVILMVAGTGGSVGGGVISASGIGAAIGVPAAVASAGLVTAGAGNFASGLAGLGQALSTGGGGGRGPAVSASPDAAKAYPRVMDLRTGKPIPFPGESAQKVAKSARVSWGLKERGAYISEWYRRGYATPEGGWDKYDIHHILPREYGGGNDFWNLVPVSRGAEHELFNSFWRQFPP